LYILFGRAAMLWRTALFSALLVAQSSAAGVADRFTLQVASFPNPVSARAMAEKLQREGEDAVCGSVMIPRKGKWIRIYVGSFGSLSEARKHGEGLVKAGLIKEFLVKPAAEIRILDRPRTVANPVQSDAGRTSKVRPLALWLDRRPERATAGERSFEEMEDLPKASALDLSMLPPLEADGALDTDPEGLVLVLAYRGGLPAGDRKRGGLRVTGNIREALDRLRWIAGEENADAVIVDREGWVGLDCNAVARVVGAGGAGAAERRLLVANHILANEGLLLIVQLTRDRHVYRLHLGAMAPTMAGEVAIRGSINLDGNFDSRINPVRRREKKLKTELPPEGIDSLIAVNPDARWLNLSAGRFVPVGNIVFHELAEAYAKLALGLDYLPHGPSPGAHDVAVHREEILRSQRPRAELVVTQGANRLLTSEDEMLVMSSPLGAGVLSEQRPSRRRRD
jgi:hypothetical protein